jgi:hypothetical protein
VGKKIASWILLRNRGIKKCCQWFFSFRANWAERIGQL